MRRRHGWHLLAGLALLGMQAGCMSGMGRNSHDAPTITGDGVASSKDLPPDETGKVCLTTAEMLFKAGQDREAIALYERARSVDPKQAQVCRRLAVLYERQGQTQKAQAEYDRALTMYPRDPGLLNDLGYSCYCRGKFDEAERHLRKAVALDPTHKRAWTNLGMTLGQRGRRDESLTAFANAVPKAQAHSNLGFLLASQGKKEDAREEYRKALELDSGLTMASAALAKLDAPPQSAFGDEEPAERAFPGSKARTPPRTARQPKKPRSQPAAMPEEPVVIVEGMEEGAEPVSGYNPVVREEPEPSGFVPVSHDVPAVPASHDTPTAYAPTLPEAPPQGAPVMGTVIFDEPAEEQKPPVKEKTMIYRPNGGK